MIHILRYIKKALRQGRLLHEDKGNTQVVGFCDLNWAGSLVDKCSTTGYCVFVGGNFVSGKSQKQKIGKV